MSPVYQSGSVPKRFRHGGFLLRLFLAEHARRGVAVILGVEASGRFALTDRQMGN
jgi:hypothetical protein